MVFAAPLLQYKAYFSSMITENSTPVCHLCGSKDISVYADASLYRRVTSDCKPWNSGGNLARCHSCNTVQSLITDDWRAEAEQIYKHYEVYHQGEGVEQAVFDSSGASQTRSIKLVSKLCDEIELNQTGHILDIGCANGNFLRAFGSTYPNWQLSGAEFDSKHACDLQTISNFSCLYSGSLDNINRKFDLITLIHTLEHIPSPQFLLKQIGKLLNPKGFIFIQVPHYIENPFELMTVDHASHFDVTTLSGLLYRSGFNTINIATDWVSKEISLIASLSETVNLGVDVYVGEVQKRLEWLEALITHAKKIQLDSCSFGLFGSSIAATWTATNLPRLPHFFVDEDPSRTGKTHMGKRIIHPDSIPDGSVILVALQPAIQKRILERYHFKTNCRWLGSYEV
jgi:2-polyprenyl-3-methyl-5-hydroxy-6-metoxy-1,4-benzoquinol methylase